MEHLTNILELVSDRFTQFASSDVVVGDPIKLESVTIIPLSRISIGFGGGGGQGEGEFGHLKGKCQKGKNPNGGKGFGGGAGGGGKIRPVGIIVFDDQGVHIHPVTTKKGLLDKIFDKFPDVMDLIQQATERKLQADSPSKSEE